MPEPALLSRADWLNPERLRRIALAWVAAAAIAAIFHIWSETRIGLTNGQNIPLGEDFINYWSGAVLAASGRAHAVYDFAAFHKFQSAVAQGPIQLYHYSYPPVMLMISRPLAFLPYIVALALWSLAGWAAFAFALYRLWPSKGTLLYALAVPATFLNLMEGQNGLWTAAILGLGLVWLPHRPLVCGFLFGLLAACKPQLALLLPLALLAARNWRALGTMIGSALLLLAATIPLYGWDLWNAYRERVTILRHAVLENGDTWFYMPSVFIMVRHLPAAINTAYAAQAVVTLAVTALVVWAWSRRDLSSAAKNTLLVTGTMLASPYVQNYDLAIAALAPVWLLLARPERDSRRPAIFAAAAALLIAPVLGPLLARTTGVALGWLLLLPALWLGLQMAADKAAKPAQLA